MEERRDVKPKDVCLIHQGAPPDLGPWGDLAERVVLMPLPMLRKKLLHEDADCRLVLYPLRPDRNLYYKELPTLFPWAELFSYSNDVDPALEKLSKGLHFSAHLKWPITASLLHHLVLQNSPLVQHLESRLPRHGSEEGCFAAVMQEVFSLLQIDGQAHTICEQFSALMLRVLGCRNFIIFSAQKDQPSLTQVYAVRNIFEENPLLEFSSGHAVLDELFQEHHVTRWHHGMAHETAVHWEGYGLKSVLVIPFKAAGSLGGLFMAVDKRDSLGFSESDVRMLQTLGAPFSLVYHHTVHHEQVHRLTITDDLTGLYNFRYLRQFLGTEIKRSLRYEKSVSLLFIDIDNFKTVNDTKGHIVGSATLCEVGHLMRRLVRDTDVTVRYGGDEFVVILPETTLEGAVVIGERVRQRVEGFRFKGGRDLSLALTVSVGVAACPDHAASAENLLQKADMAMYAAKADKKNKIKVAN